MAKIDLDNMEKLISLMVENDLAELQYEHQDLKIQLRRSGPEVHTAAPLLSPVTASLPGPQPAAASESPTPPEPDADLVPIASPMVGTFYAAPDPDSPPFISIGTTVDPNSTVCLIEAMKVFNEIKAEVSGTVVKVNARNAEAVEYGQPLFYVRPA